MDSSAWDERYAAHDLVWGLEPNRWVAEEVSALVPDDAGSPRALDLAAGEGRNAIWLARRGWRVTAVDFSAVALERGRRLAAEAGAGATPGSAAGGSVDWVRADLTQWQPEPGAYGLVLVVYLQLPSELRRPVLRRAAAALAPGGTLLIVGHDSANLTEGVGGPQDPAVLYTAEDLLDDVRDLGLSTVRAGRAVRPVETGDGVVREAIDALVRLERPGVR